MTYTLWFTGLPASGKSTLALRLSAFLREQGNKVEVLDSDIVRPDFGELIGFDAHDREIITQCIAFTSSTLNKHGIISLAVAVVPKARVREKNRRIIRNYVEVFCKCSLEAAERNDPKGLYRMARAGKIKNFTGLDEEYEVPASPEITLDTENETVDESTNKIIDYLKNNRYLC